jgi:cytochrome d ubiquinol oxidase subunit I
MENLFFARAQMGMSLAFHILFACAGIAMPLLMVIAEVAWLRTGKGVYYDLTRAWAKGTAVLFAVGAVSGTVLSFELGLLFPRFMEHAGPIIGMPFSLEGFAFFSEAIFLGVYLYGWNRIRPWLHVGSGVLVAVSGAMSAVFVIIANAWMNVPAGFRYENGQFLDIDPIAAMGTPAAPHLIVHMVVAAYLGTAFAMAGIHAAVLLKRPRSQFHRKALGIALALGIPMALVQPIVGHWAAMQVANLQPAKLAAMEGQFRTEAGAPLRIGGVPDEEAMETRYSLDLPGGLSFLAFGSFDATVKGLEEFPRDQWPPVAATHTSFQIMVALGVLLVLVSLWALFLWYRKRDLAGSRRFLLATVIASPLGFLAVEFGWFVTEFGRQPWVIYDVLRTADTVTPMPGLVVPFTIFTLVYLGLAVAVIAILYRQVRRSPDVLAREEVAP